MRYNQRVVDTLKERLYSKLPDRPPGQCWEFRGSRTAKGYGNLFIRVERAADGRKRNIANSAHKISYELHVGPVPAGLFVCHRCDNPPCCNPEHLFVTTPAGNQHDMAQKGRATAGPSADPAWWTEERRANVSERSAQRHRERMDRKKQLGGASPDSKFCPTCRRWLSRTNFGNNKARHDGLQAHCKPCKSAANILRIRRKRGLIKKPRRATRSDKKHFLRHSA